MAVEDASAAVAACAGWNSRLAARRITQFLDQRMASSGLTIAQFGLMAQVASAGDDTLGALAERAGIDQSTLSRNLGGLEAAGLLEIAAAEGDLRRRAVWLTEHGAPPFGSSYSALATGSRRTGEVVGPETGASA